MTLRNRQRSRTVAVGTAVASALRLAVGRPSVAALGGVATGLATEVGVTLGDRYD